MKKFKIISTCASLLLMVALLVFGVYAATSVSFGISSTVSFKCENVFVKEFRHTIWTLLLCNGSAIGWTVTLFFKKHQLYIDI